MSEWPKLYQPTDSEDQVEVYQLTPATWDPLAQWCDGTKAVDPDTGNQVLIIWEINQVVYLGDYVVKSESEFKIERADGFYQRYSLVSVR